MKPIVFENFLPEQIVSVLYNYMILKSANHKDWTNDPGSTKSLIGYYGDTLMETILDMSTSVVAQALNKKLWPSYSYVRVYDKDSYLPVHSDREGSEFVLCLGLGGSPNDKSYPIYIGEIDESQDYVYYDTKNKEVPLKIESKFEMVQNNAILFSGQEKVHWRTKCQHDHFISLFMFYVDQDGKHADQKYDGRTNLGAPSVR
tara:strand:- start:302 stop:907 length:606 start_codon:yes stop_codon:yes gene_type:complete